MGKLFGGAPTPAPPPPPPAQTDDGKAAAAKAAEDERLRRQGAGRASTILNGGTGLQDDPELAKKYLTGSA